ncbi:MAG TPA: glycosyltransferase family 39 protein [Candidatus Limnocylindrales bacterium]|nr:glycosyltransferase family 39 protein [Candidatus Limnocylindrales bacterium]
MDGVPGPKDEPGEGTTPTEPVEDNPPGEPGPMPGPGRPWHRPMPGWVAPVAALARSTGETLRDPTVLFQLLLVFSVVMRVIWLDVPASKTIFDETYYVNAARVILGVTPPEGGKYRDRELGLDPNKEHPPLGKLLIAGSMTVFGDNGLGWRVPSVIAGMLVLVALWLVILAAGGSRWLALLAVFLVSLDNLSMVHGRIAVLDIMALAPALLASWLALRRRWVLAAVFMALALLVKLTAMYAIGAIGLLWLLQTVPGWWAARRIDVRELLRPVTFVVLTVVLFVGGLGLLDSRWSEFKHPVDHISHMVSYGARLGQPVGTVGICPKADSRPLQWPANDCQIQYYRSDVSVRAGDDLVARVSKIDFRGAMNELLVGAMPIAMLFAIWFAWRRRDGTSMWAVTWGAANWLPYVLLGVISNRIMYIYYFLPAVPAVATAIAVLLLRSKLPRFVLWGFLVLYVIGFIAYFPYRQLP